MGRGTSGSGDGKVGPDRLPAPGKAPSPPRRYTRTPGGFATPFPNFGDDGQPRGKWQPPDRRRPSRGSRGYGRETRPYRQHGRQYHHYYYRVVPRYYVYGGWGAGWYDPWWWGNYWWPGYSRSRVEVYHYYNYYDRRPVEQAPYYRSAPWMDSELHTALTDVAVAWSTGDIELIQAHMTPAEPIAVRYDWDQQDPWVLAAPVMLDIIVDALDAQTDSDFRFVQVEEMEPGLVWAVAEHSFRLEGDGERQATMEFMFRRYEDAWLIEAITADPEKYWWLDAESLDDAARESARLFDEMDQARDL